MLRRNLLAALVLLIAAIVITGAVAVYYVTRPPAGGNPPVQSTACSGPQTYAGTVTDTNGTGLGGVVLMLAAIPPNQGVNATAVSGPTGAWAAAVSGTCPYAATLFWQSAASGPRLGSVTPLTHTSSVRVNVSRAPVTLQWMKEYPNSPGTNASVFLPARNLTFSVEAQWSGSIPLGFLELDWAMHPAMNFTYPGFYNASSTSPFAVADAGAVAYRVVDANGNWVIYAAPGSVSALSTVNVTENITMTQAIFVSTTSPYATVPAHQTLSWQFAVQSQGGLDPLGIATVAFGTTLLGYSTIYTQNWPNTYPTATMALTNPGGGSVCYVVYGQLLNVHAWYYGAGKCP